MYLGVDVGGTKTLVAVFTKNGELKQSLRFETPQNYSSFLTGLTDTIQSLDEAEFQAACVALPAAIDRKEGVGLAFGNLPWKNVHVAEFLEKFIKAPVLLENDAKLAGLYEAKNIKGDYKKVLFLTISTGVGVSLIIDGVIDINTNDLGGAVFPIDSKGRVISLDKFVSGKSIAKEYGKRASELDDPKAWQKISRDFARGLIDIISLLQPDVVIVGGGVGAHFKKFGTFLKTELRKYEMPIMKIPPVVQAKRPEEAVIYGCYELLKAHYG